MNEIVKLYKENPVRIIEKDGDPWFVAKDVAEILGYSETNRMTARLDDDEIQKFASTKMVDANSKAREFTIINESGLYNAIIGSKKPEAKAFKRWVTHDVLPSIRKTGAYFTRDTMLEKMVEMVNTIGEHFNQIIAENRIFREQMEYASQFVPKTKYGSVSPANGQRRTTIRRGANVAGKGRLIEKRNPEEVGYQMDLFGEYLPQIVFNTAVNFISNGDVSKLGNATV